MQVADLPHGCTHVYTFWDGITTEARIACGLQFSKSSTVQHVIIVGNASQGRTRAVAQLYDYYGFVGAELVQALDVRQVGSKSTYTAMIIRKDHGRAANEQKDPRVVEHLAWLEGVVAAEKDRVAKQQAAQGNTQKRQQQQQRNARAARKA